MKLIHFLPEKWALEAIKKQRLKVSKYVDLNDPFELMAMSMENRDIRQAMRDTKENLNKALRIISCSKTWSSPLVWGHYADKHKGMGLVLEVPDEEVHHICYKADRGSIYIEAFTLEDRDAEKAMIEMFSTKYEQWSYEDEARLHFSIDDVTQDGGHEFIDIFFNSNIRITGLILGALNNATKTEIQKFVPSGIDIEVITSRPAFKSFSIVPNRSKPPYSITGKG